MVAQPLPEQPKPMPDTLVFLLFLLMGCASCAGISLYRSIRFKPTQATPDYPAKIINAPCFLPNALAGDYWVIVSRRAGSPSGLDST
jgi:hypothetical protein